MQFARGTSFAADGSFSTTRAAAAATRLAAHGRESSAGCQAAQRPLQCRDLARSRPQSGLIVNPSAEPSTATPRQEYERRLLLCRADALRLTRRERQVGLPRLIALLVFFGLLIALVIVEERTAIGMALGVVGVAVLVVLIVHHNVLRALAQARWAATFLQRGLHRLDDDWSGRGTQGQRFFDVEHPYAADLDLFGPGSLFERLCTARTALGEETLAKWLLAPATPEEVRERQTAIAELRERLDLRLDLGVQGGPLAKSVDFAPLLAWGVEKPRLTSVAGRVAVTVLGVSTTAAAVAWLMGGVPTFALLGLLIVEMIVAGLLHAAVQAVVGPVERRGRDLLLLQGLLARIEVEQFASPLLRRLVDSLLTQGTTPSLRLAQLAARVDWLDSRRNGLFTPVAALLLWTTQCAFALEAWRIKTGPALSRWLAVVGELKPYRRLATFAYENPADPFPELTDERPLFDGEGLGHPLLTAACVRNDVQLGGTLRLLVVSGSNMSGKSTLLRTVGINTVLALAGRDRAGQALAVVPTRRRRHTPRSGFAASGPLAFLCRDRPRPTAGRFDARAVAAAVFAG